MAKSTMAGGGARKSVKSAAKAPVKKAVKKAAPKAASGVVKKAAFKPDPPKVAVKKVALVKQEQLEIQVP